MRGVDGVEMNREIQVLSETFPRFWQRKRYKLINFAGEEENGG